MKTVVIILSVFFLISLTSFASTDPAQVDKSQKLDITPELIHQIPPVYPETAKTNEHQGKVYISACVNKYGSVIAVELQKTSGIVSLDQAALDAVIQFKFKPGILDKKPVSSWVTIPVEFKLDDALPITDEPQQSHIMPEMIKMIDPVYPEEAKKSGKEGNVWVKALVSKEGNVLDAVILKSDCKNCGFEESALKAAMLNKYKPAIKDNIPESVWVTYKVVFNLDTK